MTSILEGELAATITAALIDANVPYDVTVTRTVQGAYDPVSGTYETTTTDYPCKGFTEAYSEFFISAGLVQLNDVKVVVLLPTLTGITPAPGDEVTVRGKVHQIINVARDPALATVEIQARGA